MFPIIVDNRVLIVIGGDDNYKADEHAFLSQWAWRKIYSQFTEDFIDGTTSFIFSWDKEHKPIHEEALNFYLDPRKPKQKFVTRKPVVTQQEPKPVPPPTPSPPYPIDNPEVSHTDTPDKATGKPQEQSLIKTFPSNEGRPLPPEPEPGPDVKGNKSSLTKEANERKNNFDG